MYLFSLVSLAHDIIMASSDTVGELVSDFAVYSLFDLPLPCPLAHMFSFLSSSSAFCYSIATAFTKSLDALLSTHLCHHHMGVRFCHLNLS